MGQSGGRTSECSRCGVSYDRVFVELSIPAAVFLEATVGHMNQAKILPADDKAALETSAWLEEIQAATRKALDHA